MEEKEVVTGGNELEVAAPVTEETVNEAEVTVENPENGGNEQEVAAPAVQEQTPDENAKYAAARRKAEEEIAAINAEFKQRFGNIPNPVTGKPIETYRDYLEAVEYQTRAAQEKELKDKGVDPALIEQMVNNSPAVRQAQMILEQQRQNEASRQLENDLKAVTSIDPEIKTLDDLAKHESYQSVLGYVKNGLGLAEAYKLANFDSIALKKSQAAKQAAINQVKSKDHMEKTNSVAVESGTTVPIPDNVLPVWRDSYPNLTMEQLTKKYNESI